MSIADVKSTLRAVVAQIVTAHSGYPLVVELDNRDQVDQSTQTNPYLQVEFDFIHAEQKDLADAPLVQQDGQLLMCVVCKGGTGTAAADALVDFVTPYFDLKVFNGSNVVIHCRAVEVMRGKELNGLWYQPMLVNFWYHRVSA